MHRLLTTRRDANTDLEKHIAVSCEQLNLWPDEIFRRNILELDELMKLRHCVFLMGNAGCGKTKCVYTLQCAYGQSGSQVKVVYLNPKVVTTKELYGSMDDSKNEWKDGLLSKLFRDFSNDGTDEAQWMVLDG